MTNARLGIMYKNFSAWKGISHIGLGVAAMANTEALKNEVSATVFPTRHNIDIMQAIVKYQQENKVPLTHIVVSAPWISTRDMSALVNHFSMMQWVVVSHSNVGFLQADPQGVHLLRDYIELTHKYDNFSVGGNSERFCSWLDEAYNTKSILLPNMYPTSFFNTRIVHDIKASFRKTIKIGSFGAIRPLKNQLTACAAAIIISKRMKKPVEFHLSAGREEGGGNVALSAIQQMTQDVPNFELVLDGWCGWLEHREHVKTMDLLIHPSYTESFNLCTADGVSQGVPVVGSHAIHWLPEHWKADSDNALEIAKVGIQILNDGAADGIAALKKHNDFGMKNWKKFLAS